MSAQAGFGDLRARLAAAVSLPVRGGHVALLDGWRGLCILLVLVGHFVPALDMLGNIGVEFFFVLSGRLMADILVFKRQPIPTFLKRRFARVIPALAAYVLMVGIVTNVAMVATGHPPQLLSPVAALFLFHNFIPLQSIVAAFQHTWSLAVEEHSYLLLVLIAFVSARRPRLSTILALLLCLAALINGMRLFAHPDGIQFIIWRSDYRVASVLFSFALYTMLRRAAEGGQPPRLPWLAPVTAALATAGVFLLDPVNPAQLAICTILAAMAVNTLEVSAAPVRKLLQHPFLLWAGTLSFSLYVWQQLFYCFTLGAMPGFIALPLTVVAALWSFKRVEEPARNYLNSRWAPVPDPVAACTTPTARAATPTTAVSLF